MKAGRMDMRLEVWRLEEAEANGFSEQAARYVCVGRWWAERVKLSGRRSEQVGEHFAAYDASFNMRAAHQPAEGWRVRTPDGYLFEVAALERARALGMLTIHCFRVNE